MLTTSCSGTSSVRAILAHLLGLQVAVLDRLHLALQPAQVEEQLLLRRRGAHLHQRPAVQDVFLDRRADPPHGVGGQAEAAVRIEALHRLHHADIAFADQLADRQAVAAVAHGDLGDEPQMGGDELVGRLQILMVAPAARQLQLLLGGEHRELADLLQIARERLPSGATLMTAETTEGSFRLSGFLSCPTLAQDPKAED